MKKLFSPSGWLTGIILTVGLFLALAVRFSLLDFSSSDYQIVLRKWFDTLMNSGFSALGGDFYNYTPAYMYILYLSVRLVLVLPLSGKRLRMVGLKLPSTVGDFFLAGFAAAIVRKKYSNRFVWLAAFLAVLLTPTVVLNSAAWGQADVFYTAALLACIYFLLYNRPNLAVFAFGMALSFKLQAMFLFPFIIALCLLRWIPWKSLLWVPLVYLISVLPAWLVGRPIPDLLMIYFVQSGEYHNLVNNAPNLYLWLPQSAYQVLFPIGLIFAACMVFLFFYVVKRSKAQVTQELIIQLATCSALLVPFVLPKMHERYFYPADVLSIIYAFYFPHYFYLPFIVVLASFLSYMPFLYALTPVPPMLLPGLTLTALTLVMINLLRALYPHGILSMKKAPKNL